jgi:hypothetical protein
VRDFDMAGGGGGGGRGSAVGPAGGVGVGWLGSDADFERDGHLRVAAAGGRSAHREGLVSPRPAYPPPRPSAHLGPIASSHVKCAVPCRDRAALQDRVLEAVLSERRKAYDERAEAARRALLRDLEAAGGGEDRDSHGQCCLPPPVGGDGWNGDGGIEAGAIDNSDAEGSEEEVLA